MALFGLVVTVVALIQGLLSVTTRSKNSGSIITKYGNFAGHQLDAYTAENGTQEDGNRLVL